MHRYRYIYKRLTPALNNLTKNLLVIGVQHREDVRNLILGYPSLKNKNFGTFLGEIHRINPEILGYPRIPGYPLTTSLQIPSI